MKPETWQTVERRILIIGGTALANHLSVLLVAQGINCITSLAGRTRQPNLPAGEVRFGGFGGAEGLQHYLQETRITAVVDASHAFAVQIGDHAKLAAEASGLPLYRLVAPAWQAEAQDRWINVPDVMEAVAAIPANARVFVTTGHKQLDRFLARDNIYGVVRLIEPYAGHLPAGWTLLLQRPPYDVAREILVMREHGITHLVSKNSGGRSGLAKLLAARQLGIPVIMIERPKRPAIPAAATAENLITLLSNQA